MRSDFARFAVERRQGAGVDACVGRDRRPLRIRRFSLERVDFVFPILVDAEGGQTALRGNRQRRTASGDPGQTAPDIGDLADRAAPEGHAKQVGDAVLVGDEIQRTAIGGPLRVDVLRVRDPRHLLDRPGRGINRCQSVGAEIERPEVGRKPVGRKGDQPAVGRPGRLHFRVRVVGQRAHLPGGEVVYIKVGQTAAHPRERHRLPVRRPGGIEDLIERGELDFALLGATGGVEDGECRMTAGDGRDRNALAVCVPRAGGINELDARGVLIGCRAGQSVDDAAGGGIGDEEIDRQQAPFGEERDPFPVGAERRSDVQIAAGFFPGDDVADFVRRRGRGENRLIGAADGRLPLGGEIFFVHAQHTFDRHRRAAGRGPLVEHPADRVVAPPSGDIGPERLAPAIRKILRVIEVVDCRQLVVGDRVTKPHRRVRIDRAERQVFGHAFDEPEWQSFRAGPAGAARQLIRDVVLKSVHQLVADDMVGVGKGPCQRQHNPPAHRFGDAARALAELSLDGVGLFKIRMRRVQNQRLPAGQCVIQSTLETGVPSLGHSRGDLDPFTLARIKIDVEMLGLQNLKIEFLVLDLVATEVLRRGGRGRPGEHEDGQGEGKGRTAGGGDIAHGPGPLQMTGRTERPGKGHLDG